MHLYGDLVHQSSSEVYSVTSSLPILCALRRIKKPDVVASVLLFPACGRQREQDLKPKTSFSHSENTHQKDKTKEKELTWKYRMGSK